MSVGVDRWRPVRAGIVNLYEYGDQTFQFAGGRLLLRGHNTSGKTKALELLLPFCLDGDISPRRLDPFASSAKDMHWNLIGCGEDDQRTGYVWLEFERLSPDAGSARLSVGIGLRANRSSRDVKRWYFVARDRIVGGDLDLVREDREPISRAELTARIGDDGEVVDTQAEYRRRLNDLLFGFADEDRYRTMLRLMLELRRPHLSKTLEPDEVATLLSAGLPSVDEALMRRLAGGLEQLDALEQALARLRTTAGSLQEFHSRAYRGYLRSVIRERGERVRRAHSRVDAAADSLRSAEAGHHESAIEAENLTGERAAADADVLRLEGELQALTGSAAWSGVAEVEALRQRAEAQERAAAAREEASTEAAAAAARLEAEGITATAAADEARRSAEGGLRELELLAERAGLAARVAPLAIQLRDDSLLPATWAELVRDLGRDWRAVLAAHAEQLDRCREARARAQAARDAERAAAERVAAARERIAETGVQLESARDGFDGAVDAWQASLVELAARESAPSHPAGASSAHASSLPPPPTSSLGPLDAAVEAARALGHQGSDPRPALADVADGLRATIGAERATAVADAGTVAVERKSLTERISAIESERDEGPAAPALERSARDQRPGGPFWRLVDFREGLDEWERAGLEAALEASGLLDAWVLPDGALLNADTLDATLTSGPRAPAPTLADVLEATGGDVAPDVLTGLLSRVGLRGGASEDGVACVCPDGGYAIGPLRGRASKPAAEHIGAGARAARRARLIAELRSADDAAAARAAEIAGRIAELDERAGTVQAELAACPDAAAVAAALRAHDIAGTLAARAAAEHEQALAGAREAGDAEVAADASRRDHACAHGLDPAIDDAGLRARSDAAAELAGSTAGVGRSWQAAAAAREHVAAMTEALTAATSAHAEREELARAERAEALRLVSEHAARDAALGESAADLRARHERVTTTLRERRDARGRLADGERDAVRELDARARAVADAASAHEQASAERDTASTRFAGLGPAGAFELGLGVDAPDDAAAAEDWTRTRTLEFARAVADAVRGASSATGELGQDVTRRVQLLDRELAATDLGAYTVRRDDDLVLVRITDEAGDRDLGEVIDALNADIAERERLLTAEERRVFGDALVQEIADHLRERIRSVHDRVAAMNAVLARSPTAAGKHVQLEWRAVEDDTGARRAAIDLLRRAARHYGPDDQRQIVEFFRGRVEQARLALEGETVDESMSDTLTRAFDYRRWFAFGLIEESLDGRERLTKRRHAVGSGGEQSVLIHLPLFAAAAALYGDSPGPRLVMLDEALSGIDDETRERVLGATVAFDLDLVMTSHELWGTYRSVPSLAVYQLHREQGVRGVHAVPFRWDGSVLHELEQAELPV